MEPLDAPATCFVIPAVTRNPADHRTTRRRTWTSLVSVLVIVLASQALSAVPASAAPQTISGTVSFGTSGNHPAGVTAVITWDRLEGSNWYPGPSAGIRTDAEGRYGIEIEPGLYRLRYSPSSNAYQTQYWNGRSATLLADAVVVGGSPLTAMDMTLPVLGEISGRVFLGDTSRPAGAGQVRATAYRCYEDGCVSGGEPTALTDASGSYRFSGLGNGVYTIRFAYLPGLEYQEPSAPVVATVSNSQQIFSGQDVTMRASPSISGTVFLGSAGTRAGADEVMVTARKYVSSPNGSTLYTDYVAATDADGNYAFPALPSSRYDLKFDYVGDGGFAAQWWPANPVASPNTTPFTLGEEPLTRDMTLPLGASVSGTVSNAAGAPIGNVQVTASALDPGSYYGMVAVDTVQTAADGTYAFEGLPPAASAIEFWSESDYGQARIDLDLRSGDVHTGLDVTMYRYTSLSGTIECPGCGDPHAVAQYLLAHLERNVGTRSEPAWIDAGTDFVTSSNSADRAVYSFDGLMPGSYRVRITGDWGVNPKWNASPAVQVDDGDNITLDLTIEFLEFDRDFSGDGRPDVVVRTGGGALLMYTGDGASGWTGASTIGSGWSAMNHVFAAGDFSGDGHEDVMARDAGGRLHLYRGDGEGGWLGWGPVGTGWEHMTAIFSPGDFSGDGNVDVLARDGAGNLWLYPGDGRGGWGAVSQVGSGWNIFDQVFAVGNYGGYGEANVMGRTGAGDLWVYPSSGSGGWTFPARVGTGWGVFDAVFGSGDFNGDGTDDVMGRDRAGRLWLYPGAGHNDWGAPAVVGTGWGHLSFVS
jgi:hypothetical protein